MAKIDLNRVPMPTQDAKQRARNFEEVALGYSYEEAVAEANRCILCPRRPCTDGCPVGMSIPEFIKALREGNLLEAAWIIKGKNALPAVCGRVCPQESQCESFCVLAKKDAPIAIGRLERFIADWEQSLPISERPAIMQAKPTGKKVAVVGSGPAGLTAAGDLARMGHQVTVFEAFHVAGGVLVYGIPQFRLPKEIVQAEVDYISSFGVDFIYDAIVGRAVTVDELLADSYRAVFLGTGAGLPMFLNIPGENSNGVYSANEFLTRANLMRAYLFPQFDTPIKRGRRVAVIGAGNTAMDAARCALRLGAEEVSIVYRRSEAEIPARHEEVEHAKEEGIDFKLLTNPTRILANERDFVVALECLKMKLGEPDASGRRRPIPIEGSEFILEMDTVIVALGTTPNPLVPCTTQGLITTKHGTVVADERSGKTQKDRVWAGGDVVTGGATVISAMGAGKRAARAIDEYLKD